MNNKILKLELQAYRNYPSLVVKPDRNVSNVIITGVNGSGKTNILEAISLLSPGKGIRGCALSDIHCQTHKGSNWRLNSDIDGFMGPALIENIIECAADTQRSKRSIRINGINLKTQGELSEVISISWLTPQHDQLFISSSQNRRKYLDRMVQNYETQHAKNLVAYEHAMRERAKLLKTRHFDNEWLMILEKTMAKNAVLVAAARQKLVGYLNEIMTEIDTSFPQAELKLSGKLENQLIDGKDLASIEDEFISELHKNRNIDMISGRTNAGIHKTDLLVSYKSKNIEASKCSTGEQKSLLLSIFLADVSSQVKLRGRAPVLLLDEVLAHLDEGRREILCQIIKDVGAQTWITGTEKEVFKPIEAASQFFRIENCSIVEV